MLDYINMEEQNRDLNELLTNPLLSNHWIANVENETGEIKNYTARWKGLYLKTKFQSEGKVRLKIDGSLSVFRNNGNNITDLNRGSLIDSLNYLERNGVINPAKAVPHVLEFGLNIPISQSVSEVLDTFLLYRTTPFKQMRNTDASSKNRNFAGIECDCSQFQIKIYDKGSQYSLKENLLRFEIKSKRMQFFKRNGINITSVGDLTDRTVLRDLQRITLDIYDKILKAKPADKNDLKTPQKEVLRFGQFRDYWIKLHRDSPRKFRAKRRQFLELQKWNNYNLHSEIRNKIFTKWERLQADLTVENIEINNEIEVLELHNLIVAEIPPKLGICRFFRLAFRVNNDILHFWQQLQNSISNLLNIKLNNN